MAIYHLTAKIVSRAKGKSSTAASAYRAGEKIRDARTGLIFDYSSRKRDGSILHENTFMPPGIDWKPNRSELWNAVEAKNVRKDSQLAREIEVSLPHELNGDERWKLASEFARNLTIDYGVAADICLHAPRGGNQNYHAHILLTTNFVESNGLGGKNREMNSRNILKKIRKNWEVLVNESLERAGHDIRVDCRSFEDQRVDLLPTIHEGPIVTALERAGIQTDVHEENRRRKNENAERQKLKADLAEIQKELTELDEEEKLIPITEDVPLPPEAEEIYLDIATMNDEQLQSTYGNLYQEIDEIFRTKRDLFLENAKIEVENAEAKKREKLATAVVTLNELLNAEPSRWSMTKHREWNNLREATIGEVRDLLENAGGEWGKVTFANKNIMLGDQPGIQYRQSVSFIEEILSACSEAAADELWRQASEEADIEAPGIRQVMIAISEEIERRADVLRQEEARRSEQLRRENEEFAQKVADERRKKDEALAADHNYAEKKLNELTVPYFKSGQQKPYLFRPGEPYIGMIVARTAENRPGENSPDKVAPGLGGFVFVEHNSQVRVFFKMNLDEKTSERIEKIMAENGNAKVTLTLPKNGKFLQVQHLSQGRDDDRQPKKDHGLGY